MICKRFQKSITPAISLAEIAELKRRMAEAIEQRDAEIEGLKLSLSKQGKELAELRKEHDLLKSANEKDQEELLQLQESLVVVLRTIHSFCKVFSRMSCL